MAANNPDNCLACGACCFSPSEMFVRVTGEDWARLGADAAGAAHFIGHRAFMRMRNGHCAALEIRRGAEAAPEFFCTLYEIRPQICRALQRGSPECEGERSAKAERAG
jgi:Fe-S-cluster containining protein